MVNVNIQVSISRQKPKEGGLNCMKGEGELASDLDEIFETFKEVGNIKLWDGMFISHTIYESVIEENRGAYIACLRFKAPPLIASRDFCTFSGYEKRAEGFLHDFSPK